MWCNGVSSDFTPLLVRGGRTVLEVGCLLHQPVRVACFERATEAACAESREYWARCTPSRANRRLATLAPRPASSTGLPA